MTRSSRSPVITYNWVEMQQACRALYRDDGGTTRRWTFLKGARQRESPALFTRGKVAAMAFPRLVMHDCARGRRSCNVVYITLRSLSLDVGSLAWYGGLSRCARAYITLRRVHFCEMLNNCAAEMLFVICGEAIWHNIRGTGDRRNVDNCFRENHTILYNYLVVRF